MTRAHTGPTRFLTAGSTCSAPRLRMSLSFGRNSMDFSMVQDEFRASHWQGPPMFVSSLRIIGYRCLAILSRHSFELDCIALLAAIVAR